MELMVILKCPPETKNNNKEKKTGLKNRSENTDLLTTLVHDPW